MSAELTKLLDERALRRLVDWYAQSDLRPVPYAVQNRKLVYRRDPECVDVEASVRSLASRDEPAIRAMVTRIIDERISDGQFDECDLTLRDLERIRNAFVEQLLGMYHTRIAYPQNTVVELESRRPAAAAGGGGGVPGVPGAGGPTGSGTAS